MNVDSPTYNPLDMGFTTQILSYSGYKTEERPGGKSYQCLTGFMGISDKRILTPEESGYVIWTDDEINFVLDHLTDKNISNDLGYLSRMVGLRFHNDSDFRIQRELERLIDNY